LDFLQKHFSNSFSFTKLKGKRNYLGVYAFFDFLSVAGDSLSSTQTTFILKILHWSLGTEFGELDELDFYGEEFSFIPEIHAGGSFVFDESNPYKDVEFVIWARTKAKKSDIIITNNHILFQDIISEGSLL